MLEASGVEAAPFVDAEGRYVGVVTLETLRRASAEPDAPALASLVDTSFLPIHQDVHLDVVLDTLTSTPQTWVAVVDDERRVIGTIATSDLIASYRRSLQASLRRVSEVSESSGMLDVVVAENSPIVGASLRAAAIPRRCAHHRHRAWQRGDPTNRRHRHVLRGPLDGARHIGGSHSAPTARRSQAVGIRSLVVSRASV